MVLGSVAAVLAGLSVTAYVNRGDDCGDDAPAPAAITTVSHDAVSPVVLAHSAVQLAQPGSAEFTEHTSDSGGTYVHVQQWRASAGGGRCIVARDVQRWSTPAQSWVEVVVLPPQPAGLTRARYLTGPPAGSEPIVTEYEPGHDPSIIAQPSTDPGVLAGQLAAHPPAGDQPQHLVRKVVRLYEHHLLTPAQRSAALLVLSNIDALRWRGQVRDRAGRPGSAVTLDTRQRDGAVIRDVLVFDDIGVLLSHETETLSAQDSSQRTVTAYILILTVRRWPAGTTPPAPERASAGEHTLAAQPAERGIHVAGGAA